MSLLLKISMENQGDGGWGKKSPGGNLGVCQTWRENAEFPGWSMNYFQFLLMETCSRVF